MTDFSEPRVPNTAYDRDIDLELDDPDDDGDDDEQPADGESFDGGYGPGSYFNRAMHKD